MMYGLILGLGILISILLAAIFRLEKGDFQHLANRMADRSRKTFGVLKPCPLCGSMLERGQSVRTKVFSMEEPRNRASDRPQDSLVHMFGCPFCDPREVTVVIDPQVLPGPGSPLVSRPRRICPSCSKELAASDYVIARLFESQGKKPHLHVLGCTRCRR